MSWQSILKTPYRIIVYEGSHEEFLEQLDDGTMKKNMEKYLGTHSMPLENSAIEVYIDKKSTERFVMSKKLAAFLSYGIDSFIERSIKVYQSFSSELEPNDILQVSFKRHMPQKVEGQPTRRVEIADTPNFSQSFQELNKM